MQNEHQRQLDPQLPHGQVKEPILGLLRLVAREVVRRLANNAGSVDAENAPSNQEPAEETPDRDLL